MQEPGDLRLNCAQRRLRRPEPRASVVSRMLEANPLRNAVAFDAPLTRAAAVAPAAPVFACRSRACWRDCE